MARARETAEIIAGVHKETIKYSDLFIERLKPSEVVGKEKTDPVVLEIESLIKKNFKDPNFRFSNEETFLDLKTRARQALEYLSSLPGKNILVVTHGFFMRIVIAYVIHSENLKAEDCLRFLSGFHTENTGVTVLNYTEKEAGYSWWVHTWNDFSHLE